MLSKQWLISGALSGFFAVAFGAFGAHALKDKLSDHSMAIYQTAVHYQMFHSLALIGLALWAAQNPMVDTQLTGWAFTVGILLFCGSLYALALTELRFLGAITPFGGLLFLAGWIGFAFLAWKS